MFASLSRAAEGVRRGPMKLWEGRMKKMSYACL